MLHRRGLLARIKSVTDKPVVTIINTHTQYDHSGSNTEFPATVEFVAHENTRSNMAKPTCPPVTNCEAFKGDNAKYLPKRTFKDKLTLLSGKVVTWNDFRMFTEFCRDFFMAAQASIKKAPASTISSRCTGCLTSTRVSKPTRRG